MTVNLTLYLIRPDNETFSLDVIEFSGGVLNQRMMLSLTGIREQISKFEDDDIEECERGTFFLAARILFSGERHQRGLYRRMTATGTRNIRLTIRKTEEYLTQTLESERKRNANRNKSTQNEQMRIDELKSLIHDTFAPIKQRLGLPLETADMYSYVIPEIVISRASDGCRSYLARIQTRQPLTGSTYMQVCDKLRRDFAQDAEGVIGGMKQGREHLSAISLNSTEGQLVVSIVNQRGDMFSMEGWKLLRLIEEHDTPLDLGTLDRIGNWEPKPILALNNNTSGAIIAVYTANDSTLQVLCRKDAVTKGGQARKGESDKAVFMLDQDYLVSAYVAIAQLKHDKQRFEELRETAEARKAVNIEGLFDPGFFENS